MPIVKWVFEIHQNPLTLREQTRQIQSATKIDKMTSRFRIIVYPPYKGTQIFDSNNTDAVQLRIVPSIDFVLTLARWTNERRGLFSWDFEVWKLIEIRDSNLQERKYIGTYFTRLC